MRLALALLPLCLVAACVSPRDQCLSDATRELRINEALIAKTSANLQRGYAVDVEQRVSRRPGFCRSGFGETTRFGPFCDDVRVRNVAVPEAINTRVEQETLDQLLARRAQLRAASEARVGQCRSLYPS